MSLVFFYFIHLQNEEDYERKESLVSAKSFCNVKNLGLISSLGIQPFSLPLFC